MLKMRFQTESILNPAISPLFQVQCDRGQSENKELENHHLGKSKNSGRKFVEVVYIMK